MAIQKNFVVKNGLEVNDNLIFADTTINSVGIATTIADYTLHVNGGIGATDLYVSGIATASAFYGDGSNLTFSGPLSLPGLVVSGVSTLGVTTATDLTLQNLYVSGIGTIINSSITNLTGTAATIGAVQISSGIVTASSGIVTYYGDGQYLQNILSGVGVATESGLVGTGATILDFRGAGISTVTVASGIATINITGGGGGGGAIGIGSTFPGTPASLDPAPSSGDLFFHIDYGRTFLYYDEVALGIGATAVWIDSAPFNQGGLYVNKYGDNMYAGLGVTIGTLTNPSIYFNGYTNSGFYSPAANEFGIVVSGTEKLNVNAGGINITGVATATTLSSTNGSITNLTGTAGTITTLSSTNGYITNLTGTAATIGAVQISSGIVTASSGIVTYYGDGQYLQNILSGVGVATAGGTVGTGATILDFRGAGISTVTVVSGIATINITGGGFEQDADANLFAGTGAGGSYDPATGDACYNIFLGCNAGNSITSGDHNNFFGAYAGYCNTSGNNNNFLGCSAGKCNTTGCRNNFFGRAAGFSNTTGCHNNFLGNLAGYSNTTGCDNNFFGKYAGTGNTTGCNNNFFGHCAGKCNTTGCNNNFLGNYAGQNNTTGCDNNFFGQLAGYCNTSGCHNTFIGNRAGCGTSAVGVTGSNNTAIGQEAGRYLTSGQHNNFLGRQAGYCNTTGSNNNFLGDKAGYYTTTGGCNNFFGLCAGFCNTTGTYNNFLGNGAGYGGTGGNTGNHNNFFGNDAGRCLTSGCRNNFFGRKAGYYNTTGNQNNFLGDSAGYNNTGSHNIFLGNNAGCNNSSGDNNIAIGRHAGQTSGSPSGLINLTTASNCIVMGNASHTCAAIQVAWTVISDIRDKCVYGDVPHGKGFLQNVNPIKYSFKDRETGEVTDEKVRYGFSAQEIAELEGDETIISSKSNIDKWGVTHEHLLPVLVNAIKELDAENKELKERLTTLEEKVNSLLES